MARHEIDKGLQFNYLLDAAKYYWAARGLEINYRSVDEKDKLLDMLTVKRLRDLADKLVQQAVHGIENDAKSPSDQAEIFKQLHGDVDAKS